MPSTSTRPVFRFAPSPNGRLHLGHAYSAMRNAVATAAVNGTLLLRIEDLDAGRSKDEFVDGIVGDLEWLGIRFAGPPRRQSRRLQLYAEALDALVKRDLAFPCRCTRADLARAAPDKRDPDGAPRHEGRCDGPPGTRAEPAWRLNMARALRALGTTPTWREFGETDEARVVSADAAVWGDVVLRGRALPATYHLAVVVDDAEQGISDVVRGQDLFAATAIHRVLQLLLELPEPVYRHHRLVRDAEGLKLSKSAGAMSLNALRAAGITAGEVHDFLRHGVAAAPRPEFAALEIS